MHQARIAKTRMSLAEPMINGQHGITGKVGRNHRIEAKPNLLVRSRSGTRSLHLRTNSKMSTLDYRLVPRQGSRRGTQMVLITLTLSSPKPRTAACSRRVCVPFGSSTVPFTLNVCPQLMKSPVIKGAHGLMVSKYDALKPAAYPTAGSNRSAQGSSSQQRDVESHR